MGAIQRDKNGHFAKGSSANPAGRPSEPEELKFLKKNIQQAIRKYACEILGKKYDELLDLLHAKEGLLVHERMFITAAEEAIGTGSIKHFEVIYKLIGLNLNTPQKIEVETFDDSTGLENIPTDKLEKIQAILESE